MPGILYVVATPIGNLEDVTFRAIRVLRDVALIAAEDTRRTSRLLQHYSISTPTTSVREHNERARTAGLIARLARGESVALVTDAGTPTVSDPGAVLVAAAHAAGIRVEPIPGPSAAMAALSASGFPSAQVLFVGFPPPKSKARKQWLEALAGEERTLILFEAPHRILATLQDMEAIFGERPVALARELTKAHESLVIRPIHQHISMLGEPRGEFTLVVAPPTSSREEPVLPRPDALAEEFGLITKRGATRREAIRETAAKYGVPARTIFDLLEQAKAE
jgi:16S rRNA (cytidine1402-2'-O)-methyltransferase